MFSQNRLLLTIEGDSIYEDEFVRIYQKNKTSFDKTEQGNFETYLQAFIDYKLKVKEAEALGLDTTAKFRREYKAYKDKLAYRFLMNTAVSQKLFKQAYKRMHFMINASHILIRFPNNSTPEDTAKAYRQIIAIQKQLQEGASFKHLRQKYMGAQKSKGKLGWFSVFKMVYPFENAAYQTPVGEVSAPVRTRYGYHLIKVNDRRKVKGKIQVAQLYLRFRKDSSGYDAEERIYKIYQKLKEGARFSDMVKQYSEDTRNASQGGKLNPIKISQFRSSKLVDIFYGLSAAHPLSKPFKTASGWHIVNYLKTYPIPDFKAIKGSLKRQIRRSNRSHIVKDSLLVKLRKTYHLQENKPGLSYFKEQLKAHQLSTLQPEDLPRGAMLYIEGEGISYQKFLIKLNNYKDAPKSGMTSEILDNLFADFKDEQRLNYRKRHLAEINPRYANLIRDYHDGMLIFNLLQTRVWQKAKDSLALLQYFRQHKMEFRVPQKYQMLLVTSDTQKTLKAIRAQLKQGKSSKELKKKYPDAMISLGVFEAASPKLPDNFKKQPGFSKITQHHGAYILTKTLKVIPAHRANFERVRAEVINAYQQQLEKKFVQKLRNKYSVKRKHKALQKIKTKLDEE